MQPKRLNASFSVSAQITPEAIAEVAAAGFRSNICNRPDGEGANQPGFVEIEAAQGRSLPEILRAAKPAGHDTGGVARRIGNGGREWMAKPQMAS